MTRRCRTTAVLVTGFVLSSATGCSTGLGDLPLPAPGVGGASYEIHAGFANALNLPERAKVRVLGADVGEVAEMSVRDYTAVVTMRIQDGVVLPVGTRAELRTATPLGDVFVALTPPETAAPGGPLMRDGDTIPLATTQAAATIEELLTTASLLVNGGVIRNLTDIVNGLGRAVGDRGANLAALLDRSTRVVQALAARSADIRTALVEVEALTRQLREQRRPLGELVELAGPALSVVTGGSQQALTLIRQIDAISRELAEFPAIDGTAAVGMVADINRISAGLGAAATEPNASLAAMNAILGPIINVTNGTSAHVNADLQDITIGSLPDPAHPGDPGSRVPDASDWQSFVGTLTYTLLRLQQRVTGPAR
ncbi:MlaD family protein [Nocardia rosealba]|uniref:MlaD family protein n=1 Tax=Nocardia rosealba TaxID=2878563 RepID=UPI001CD9E3E3|nr:MlaD family protein [Nocardia rosealba]MCA2207830.1 MlaD family protein [Nocardia rosealba]